MTRVVSADFHVRGRVKVRLVDVDGDARRRFARWVGAPPLAADGDAHLTIRRSPDLRPQDAEDGQGIHVESTRLGRAVTMWIPFERLGTAGEIVCDSGLPAPALLRPALNLAALGCDTLPVHAAGFDSNGACLVTGPGGTGKTEALLAALRRGGRFVCSEWAFVDSAGRIAPCAQEPVRVRWRHLRVDRGLRRRLRWTERFRAALPGLAATLLPVARLAGPFERRAYVDVPPERLTDRCARAPVHLERIVLLARVDGVRSTCRSVSAAEAVRELTALALADYEPLLAHYRRYLERFPGRRNPRLDELAGTLEGAYTRIVPRVRVSRIERSRDDATEIGEQLFGSSTD